MCAAMVDRKCANKMCGKAFKARLADVKRGWGLYCCKTCKAQVHEGRTGNYAAYKQRVNEGTAGGNDHWTDPWCEIDYEDQGWDAHKDAC